MIHTVEPVETPEDLNKVIAKGIALVVVSATVYGISMYITSRRIRKINEHLDEALKLSNE